MLQCEPLVTLTPKPSPPTEVLPKLMMGRAPTPYLPTEIGAPAAPEPLKSRY